MDSGYLGVVVFTSSYLLLSPYVPGYEEILGIIPIFLALKSSSSIWIRCLLLGALFVVLNLGIFAAIISIPVIYLIKFGMFTLALVTVGNAQLTADQQVPQLL